jgi:hypothetical protein
VGGIFGAVWLRASSLHCKNGPGGKVSFDSSNVNKRFTIILCCFTWGIFYKIIIHIARCDHYASGEATILNAYLTGHTVLHFCPGPFLLYSTCMPPLPSSHFSSHTEKQCQLAPLFYAYIAGRDEKTVKPRSLFLLVWKTLIVFWLSELTNFAILPARVEFGCEFTLQTVL